MKFSEQKEIKKLIPVHINKMKCDTHFWNWSSNAKDWIRGEKIPENQKQ